jgi:hypothetical protein
MEWSCIAQIGIIVAARKVTGRILPDPPDDKTYGEGYSQRAKHIRQYFTKEYQQISQEQETPLISVN